MLRTPGTVATASAQFPLTPALSPGERERPNPTLAYRAHPQARSAASVAPSPQADLYPQLIRWTPSLPWAKLAG